MGDGDRSTATAVRQSWHQGTGPSYQFCFLLPIGNFFLPSFLLFLRCTVPVPLKSAYAFQGLPIIYKSLVIPVLIILKMLLLTVCLCLVRNKKISFYFTFSSSYIFNWTKGNLTFSVSDLDDGEQDPTFKNPLIQTLKKN
jgi:hypothetical protein